MVGSDYLTMHTAKKISNFTSYINKDHEIIKALKNNKLFIFIGAGFSKPYGMPDWKGFANKYLEYLYSEIEGENSINYRTKEELARKDFFDILSICENIVKNNNLNDDRVKFLRKTFFVKETDIIKKLEDSNNYKLLNEINAKYITTNYDNLMDYYVVNKEQKIQYYDNKNMKDSSNPKSKIYSDTHIKKYKNKLIDQMINNGDIIHIHGCITEDKGCRNFIVSREDYLDRYYDKKPNEHNELLQKIFHEHTVMFLGYGLQEMEILKYMFKNISKTMNKRYVLVDCYPDDYNYINIYEEYLRQYNIEIIPYDKTKAGYDAVGEILEIISKLNNELPKSEFINEILYGEW